MYSSTAAASPFPCSAARGGPSLLLIGWTSCTVQRAELVDDIALAGGHVAAHAGPPDAFPSALPSHDIAVINMPVFADDEAIVSALTGSALPRPRLLVTDMATLDLAHALAAPDDEICVTESRAERLAALAMLISRSSGCVRDTSYVLGEDALHEINRTVARLAEQLGEISGGAHSPFILQKPVSGRGKTIASPDDAETGLIETGGAKDETMRLPFTGDTVRLLIRFRRFRERWFDAALFADPAWDILLDLTAARMDDEKVSASSLCIAACVPPTTALRWIRMMTEKRILRRITDPRDARRVHVELNDQSFESMRGYVNAIASELSKV